MAASAESQAGRAAREEFVDAAKPAVDVHSRRSELRKALKQQPPWGSTAGAARQLSEKDRAELRQQLRAQHYEGK